MRTIDKELYKDLMSLFNKWHSKLSDLDSLDFEECIDAGYAIREALEYLNQVRRDLEKASDKLQITVAITLLSRHRKSFATEYATAVSSNKASATPPKKDKNPTAYFKLMDAIGMPREISDKELVRIHYPSFVEYCSELAAEGKCPEGIDPKELHTSFGISFRRKKGVLE